MSKHTPGPWTFDGRNSIMSGDQAVAVLFWPRVLDDDKLKTNAALIAAAPDLLPTHARETM